MANALSPRGLLIVFEGIDGAGKTTQARSLARQLRQMGVEVVESKEPRNGPGGQKLRQSGETGRLEPEEELELFVKDRREHVRDLIEPGLAAGKGVIVDRYYFSTAAYQGARGMDYEEILRINQAFAPAPDLVFILRVEPSVGRTRIAARGDRANLFEGESALAASAAIFDCIKGPFVRVLDGNRSVGELEHVINLATWSAIEPRLPQPVPAQALDRDALVREANALIADDSVPLEGKAQAL